MKRINRLILNALALMLAATCMFACVDKGPQGDPDPDPSPEIGDPIEGDTDGGDKTDKENGSSSDSGAPEGRVKMTAKVTEVGERFMVEVIESQYTSGPHIVKIASGTKLTGKDGGSISLSDIKVGDTLEIAYSGQVMLSYPPQIVAASIKII